MSVQESYLYLLVGPVGMFMTGMLVYFLAMREGERHRPPAE
jgi:hypothetical protein